MEKKLWVTIRGWRVETTTCVNETPVVFHLLEMSHGNDD
jgi:hypothetical protein